MSETNDTDEKTTKSDAPAKTLRLRPSADSGMVRQNFSHGRSKQVVVEKKRKRTIAAPGAASEAKAPPAPKAEEKPTSAPRPAPAPKPAPAPDSAARSRSGVVLRTLTAEEKDARAQALAESRVREAEDRKQAEVDARRRTEEDTARKLEQEAASARKADEEARRKADEDTRTRAETTAARRLDTGAGAKEDEARAGAPKRGKVEADRKPAPNRREEPRRRRGKLTITDALNDSPRERSLAAMKRRREREKKQLHGFNEPQAKIVRDVVIPDMITIQELSNRMAERGVDVIKLLMQQGQMHKINDSIDADTAQLIVEEMGHSARRVSEADVEEGLVGADDDDGDLAPRAPVVTVMGHVDHGKTSLLDAMRETDVVAGEAGGITQHIGAYQVAMPDGQKITFLDTPGHEAFTAMRARGARATDIVVLVVAGDDGVMPQTIEAINHAKAAQVPMIIAINKMDKPEADPTRIRNELLQHEVVPESLGGDTQEVEVSALKKMNLDKLREAILLQAEVLELKANPDRDAEGVIIEAELDRGRGPVATALVQRGTLRVGDIVVAGAEWGKVRALIDDHGDNVEEAGPSMPVAVLGLNGTPSAGDHFAVVETEGRAREVSEYRQRTERRNRMIAGPGIGSLEQMMSKLKEAGQQELPILIKGDVQGSVEAICSALDKVGNDEVKARVIHAAVGGITESDVALAEASNAAILGFNVRANPQARDAARQNGIDIRYYSVIYNLVDDMKAIMSGMLSPAIKEHFLGNAEILEVFNVSKIGKVAGCRVTEGTVQRGANVRLIRDDVVIHEGRLATLKRFKDEVKEVVSGQECGMGFENYQDLRPGDVIECFNVEEVERTL